MLKRKIEQVLLAWKRDPHRLPLVIKGLRQCGKTFSALNFARNHYKSVVYLNFFENPNLNGIFSGSLQVDHMTMMMSAVLPGPVHFLPGETIIILDEIQQCPEARTALKFFSLDGRFDVIATGSLLGVNGCGDNAASIPVGYEKTVVMRPLDFEEFLWATGISEEIIRLLRNSLRNETPIPEPLHTRMMELFLQYIVVGGMPAAVNAFIAAHNLSEVRAIQSDLLNSFRSDMTKYAAGADKIRIKECFDSIPRQLAKDNKKFQYALVRKGARSSQYVSALQWIEEAGLVKRCRNVSLPELPLEGYADPDTFKVYLTDTGLFVGMLEPGTAADILSGKLFGFKGAIFENAAADAFCKTGRDLYYFRKGSGLEVDFLIRHAGNCMLVEVKAVNGNAKSAKTILAHPEKYHVGGVFKFGQCNIGRSGQMLTLPLYLLFALDEAFADAGTGSSA